MDLVGSSQPRPLPVEPNSGNALFRYLIFSCFCSAAGLPRASEGIEIGGKEFDPAVIFASALEVKRQRAFRPYHQCQRHQRGQGELFP